MIDFAVVAGYMGLMLLIGWRSRQHSPESYWVADRRYATGHITASMVGTIFGASSTIGLIGLGYARGLTAAWWSLAGAVALVPFGLFLAHRVRALGVYTLPDILRRAYGDRVAIPAGVVIAVAWCGVISAQAVAGAQILTALFPVSYQNALAAIAAVFILYTFWGGQVSAIRTDAWQFALFLVGLVVALAAVLVASPGGGPLQEGIPDGHLSFPVSAHFGWYDLLVYYPLVVGLAYLAGPDIYSRVLCARDGRTASRSTLISAAAIVPIALVLALLGVLIRSRTAGLTPEAALPWAMNHLLPTGLRGLVGVAFLAAIMSSADTCLMSAATILSVNVIGRREGLSEARRLNRTRVCVAVVGLGTWAIAGFERGIISSLLLAYSIFVGGVALPTLASFWRDRLKVTANGAMWAVLLGGGLAILKELRGGELVRSLLTERGDGFLRAVGGPQYLSILPLFLSLAALLGVSRLSRFNRW